MHAFLMISIGVVVHFLFSAVFDKSFSISNGGKVAGLGIIVAAIAAYIENKLNIAGVIIDAANIGGGFILCFLVVKLNSIKL